MKVVTPPPEPEPEVVNLKTDNSKEEFYGADDY
jgi:hypothetical protein